MSDSMKKRAPLTSQFVLPNKSGYNLRSRKRSKHYYNMVDRISALPDEVLVSILSLCPLKEAAATSILSRRWRYVWASSMTLHFDDEKTLCGLSWLKPEIRESKIRRYVNWVNNVVKQHRGPKIEQFSVAFDLNHTFSSSIDKWIQFALRKGVQMLELDLLDYGVCFRGHNYTFPSELLGIRKGSSLNPLFYDIPSLHPSAYIGFKSLKVLNFKSVGVDGETLEYFLSNCPVLEQLSVLDSSKLGILRVVGPSTALKYLVIEACSNIQSIEICDANIVLFVYFGHEINLLLRNVPRLVEVSICEHWCIDFLEIFFTQLSCCLSQLEILKLTGSSLVNKKNRVYPILANLKHLELTFNSEYDCSLLLLTSILKASPYLHKIVLYSDYPLVERIEVQFKKAAKFSHHHLRVVELVGYDHGTTDYELVKYFIENAVRLEKLVVIADRVHPSALYWCIPKHRLKDSVEVEGRKRIEDHAREQKLRKKVPSTIELVCM